MRKQIQNPEGYETLVQLIQIFQESEGNELSFREILKKMEERNPDAFQAENESTILSVLDHYTSTTMACPDNEGQVLCIFQDLGDGQYELLADEETCQALLQEKDALVDPDLVPFSVDQQQMDANLQKQYDRMAESVQPYDEQKADRKEEVNRPSQMEADDQANGKDQFVQSEDQTNQEFGSDGMEQPQTYGNDIYDEADNQLAEENAIADHIFEYPSGQLSFEQEMPDLPSIQEEDPDSDQMDADDAARTEIAITCNQEDPEDEQVESLVVKDDCTEKIQDVLTSEQRHQAAYDSLNAQLDQANHEVERARDRADQAEEDARIWKAQAENSMDALDAVQNTQANQAKQDKIMRKIQKAQDRIQQQERKISDHKEQIEQNATGMMKSMHKAQIRHDKKVIDRKNRKISNLVQDLKDQDDHLDSDDYGNGSDSSDACTD